MNADETPQRSELPYYAITPGAPRLSDRSHAAIGEAAYFRAESRNFAPGHELEDWLAAEKEIKERLISEDRR
jgi:Protein of unknown function (DUF2934)